MTHTSSFSELPAVVAGLLVGLLVLIVETGAWCVIGALFIPHFAPEIGPLAGFLVFSCLFAAYFVPPFLLVACPFLWLARPVSKRRLWPIAALATLLVAGTVFLLSEGLDDRRSDTLFIAGFSLLPAGIGASVVLRRWHLNSPRGEIKLHKVG
jgi:hypothetical protein